MLKLGPGRWAASSATTRTARGSSLGGLKLMDAGLGIDPGVQSSQQIGWSDGQTGNLNPAQSRSDRKLGTLSRKPFLARGDSKPGYSFVLFFRSGPGLPGENQTPSELESEVE